MFLFPSRRLSTYYLAVNRNKRSVALDLSHDKGRDIARDLAKNWADVVVENFKVSASQLSKISCQLLLSI